MPRLRPLVLVLLALAALPAARPEGSAPPEVPLYEGLGGVSRKVTTGSPEAQRYFDQGLVFMYAFNHDEAIRAFRRAAELDPGCAMCFWGVAVANGPHINNPVVPPERAQAAWDALARARPLAGQASPVEQALIVAQAARFAVPAPEDRKPLDLAYANAMRAVWAAHPKDADAGALFAEALADLRPWDLWQPDGKPQPGTEELIAALEAVLALDARHPLALHLFIHAVEASPAPGRADAAADALRERTPGLGHLVHMPSHIDVRRGRWQEAITANTKAIAADASYTAHAPEQGFYRLYMAHNHHMLTYGAMMSGQSGLALRTIREMVGDIPLEFFKANPFADGFMAMPLEVLMRFGRWEEILAEPAFPDFVPISRALQHYARGVAFAAKDRVADAEAELALFLEARARVSKEAFFGNNPGSDVLDVAEAVLRGELLVRAGRHEEGIAMLREGVAREDRLRYDEPPDWIQPVRHPLGAALLQAGRFAEAEAVFRADLAKLPDNGWGLYGLSRALALQKKRAEAAATLKRFDTVWARADLTIKSPCLCLPGV
jgi:tetratricopeptide (TPR) repeat protein